MDDMNMIIYVELDVQMNRATLSLGFKPATSQLL